MQDRKQFSDAIEVIYVTCAWMELYNLSLLDRRYLGARKESDK